MPLKQIKSMSGSAIVEVVTGVFLISLATAMVVTVFTQTMDYSNLYVKHQATNALDELITSDLKNKRITQNKTNDTKFPGDQTMFKDSCDNCDFRLTKTVDQYPGQDSLQVVTYSANLKSTGKMIYSRKLIMSSP